MQIETLSNATPLRTSTSYPQLLFLGIQHVLAMYAGTVVVPLLIGTSLIKAGLLQPADLPQLIVSDLFVSGIATIIQSIGFWRFGARLPIIQGCTFASVGVMISTASHHGLGTMYGSVIACGIFMMLGAGFFSKILRFFPPLVTGTVITIIGLSLISVAGGWIMPTHQEHMGLHIALGLCVWTMIVIILVERFASPILQKMSVLIGIVVGTLSAIPYGAVYFSEVKSTALFRVPHPFQFGVPHFNLSAIIAMFIVAISIMTETSGDLIAVGEIVQEEVNSRRLSAGLRADGFSTILGAIFNTFPYTAFAQNIGLLSLTKVTSRMVTAVAGIILIILGLLPKLGALVACIPQPVLGGAGLVLFGMVTASGLKTITKTTLDHYAMLTVGLSISIALIPIVKPGIFAGMPEWFTTIFTSSVTLGTVCVIILHLLFRGASEKMQRKPSQKACEKSKLKSHSIVI